MICSINLLKCFIKSFCHCFFDQYFEDISSCITLLLRLLICCLSFRLVVFIHINDYLKLVSLNSHLAQISLVMIFHYVNRNTNANSDA